MEADSIQLHALNHRKASDIGAAKDMANRPADLTIDSNVRVIY